ncbi:MAG: hypothetical protein AB9869_33200 [Verrucomicrobiia bacterium]
MKTQKWIVMEINWDVAKFHADFDKQLGIVADEKSPIRLPKGYTDNVPCLEAMPKAVYVYLPQSWLDERAWRLPQQDEVNEEEWEDYMWQEIGGLIREQLGPFLEGIPEFLGYVDRPETATMIEVIN